jgi:hypothetical protein
MFDPSNSMPHHRVFWINRTRAIKGRIVNRLIPALPRYIVAPVNECWDVLQACTRLIGVICFGHEVARVAESTYLRALALLR